MLLFRFSLRFCCIAYAMFKFFLWHSLMHTLTLPKAHHNYTLTLANAHHNYTFNNSCPNYCTTISVIHKIIQFWYSKKWMVTTTILYEFLACFLSFNIMNNYFLLFVLNMTCLWIAFKSWFFLIFEWIQMLKKNSIITCLDFCV